VSNKNEKLTEKQFEKLLSKSGITEENDWIIEPQISKNPSFSFVSKTGKGGVGHPEFIISKKDYTGFVIVVEAKASTDKLEKLNKNKISQAQASIVGYATNGAYHYASCLAEKNNVLFIGCAGDETDFTYKTFYMQKGEADYVEVKTISLSDLNNDLKNTIIQLDNLHIDTQPIKKMKVKTDIEVTDDDAKNLAADIHELLRDHAGVPANQKPILISAVLLACDNPGFKLEADKFTYTYKNALGAKVEISSKDSEDSTEGHVLLLAALEQACNTGMEKAKLGKLESSFKFIETNSALNSSKDSLSGTALHYLCGMIKGSNTYRIPKDKAVNLLDQIKQNTVNDILGHFYSEFLSRGGSDGKDLGIVLTPAHITELMVDLVGFNIKSKLYDPCTGTAGFLVAGMNKAFKEVADDITITDKPAVLKALKSVAFIGCEVADYMFTIAATNMILRGDGKSNLFADSCFKVTETIKYLVPTCSVLNPPYSLKDKEQSELKFIEHSLDVVIPGGLVAAVVPKSIFLDKNKTLRAQILKKHSLVAVITLPTDTFIEVAGTEVAIGLFKSGVPHNPKVKTWLCEFDDGYTLIPKQGRKDVRGFQKLKAELLERLTNKSEITHYSKLVSIEVEDECLYDCWADTEVTESDDFKDKLKDLIVFNLKKGLEKYIETGDVVFKIKELDLTKEELKLDSVKWKEFVVGDLFEVERGNKVLNKDDYILGDIPFITTTTKNNGINGYISNEEVKTHENKITVALDGEPGISFYHSYKFKVSHIMGVLGLKENILTPNIGIFLCSCLEKLRPKYSYGKKLGVERFKKEKIWLPTDEYGSPDYEFMEKYIRSLAFSEILE
jgi:hypothetical protein